MNDAEQRQWNVVYVASRQEKKVGRLLADKGILTYVPLFRELKQWSDRKKWVETPLFRGYVFIEAGASAHAVLSTSGIVAYLRFQGKNAVVRAKEIEIIRRIEQSGYYAEQLLNPDEFETGEQVRVADGPLRGQKGHILRKDNHEYFTISIDSMEQSLKIKVPFELLEKV
jgi:transcription antitermination factor NusG